MTIEEAIKDAAERLTAAGIDEGRREASSLMAHAMQHPRSFLIAHPEHVLTDEESQVFQNIIGQREQRFPFQHLTGRQEFYGLEFEVSPNVLIPRPETEILVEKAVEVLGKTVNAAFLEIGVGSGCISITILNQVISASAVGIDLSPLALDVAARNARTHDVHGRLKLQEGSLFDRIDSRFDLIVSNPPYIPDGDIAALQAEVRDHEPLLALAGGPDGLSIIREIIAQAPDHLNSNSTLLIEIGYGQSDAVRDLINTDIWTSPEFLLDLQQIPRVLVARLDN